RWRPDTLSNTSFRTSYTLEKPTPRSGPNSRTAVVFCCRSAVVLLTTVVDVREPLTARELGATKIPKQCATTGYSFGGDYFLGTAGQFCTIAIGVVTASSAWTFMRNRPSDATAYCA